MIDDEVLGACFISPNEDDRNGEPANVVDGLFALSRSARQIANSIYPPGTSPGPSPSGVHVSSLIESVGGVENALLRIADSLSEIASAIAEKGR